MNAWIYFVLISELMWAFTSFIDKIMLSKNYIKNPFIFILFNGFMNIQLIFLLPFFSFGKLSPIDAALALSAGVFLTVGIIFYYKAVQCEEISRVLMLWQIIPIFVLVMSFFLLHESLTKKMFIGFAFLFAAGIIVSYKKIYGSFKLSKAFYFMMAATFPISLYYILSVHIFKVTNFWSAFMWLRLSAFSSLFLLFLPSIRKQFINTWKNMGQRVKSLITLKMIIDFSAFIFLGLAMFSGPVSLISALGSAVAPIFIFLITSFSTFYVPHIVREEISKQAVLAKFLAIALIIIGIIFINL